MIDNIRVLTLGQIRKAIVQLLGQKICVNTHDGRIEKKKKDSGLFDSNNRV